MKKNLIWLAALGLAAVLVVACSGASADSDLRDDPSATPAPGQTAPSGEKPVTEPPRSVDPGPVVTPPPPDAPVSNPPSRPGPAPGGPTPTPYPLQPGQRVEVVPAPIESVDIIVQESYPPQYAVRIVQGLPSGCARPAGYEMRREGDTVRIQVSNSVLSGSNVACTLIYGMHESFVHLGSDFESGREYKVIVNGETRAFRAQ